MTLPYKNSSLHTMGWGKDFRMLKAKDIKLQKKTQYIFWEIVVFLVTVS
jgi:hypothetical protein